MFLIGISPTILIPKTGIGDRRHVQQRYNAFDTMSFTITPNNYMYYRFITKREELISAVNHIFLLNFVKVNGTMIKKKWAFAILYFSGLMQNG